MIVEVNMMGEIQAPFECAILFVKFDNFHQYPTEHLIHIESQTQQKNIDSANVRVWVSVSADH